MRPTNFFEWKLIDFSPSPKDLVRMIYDKKMRGNLSNGFAITFFISISLTAAAFFSACSELWWDLDDAGSVAVSPLSTSTVATFTSLSAPIGSLKFQLNCSNCFLGIFTNFTQHAPRKLPLDSKFVFIFRLLLSPWISLHYFCLFSASDKIRCKSFSLKWKLFN